MIAIIAAAIVGYLLGSIPFGLLLTRLAGLGALVAGLLWLATAAVFRYSSLAGLVAALAAPIIAAFFVEPARAWLIAAIALLIILRHHENIRRLLAGTESRISFGEQPPPF